MRTQRRSLTRYPLWVVEVLTRESAGYQWYGFCVQAKTSAKAIEEARKEFRQIHNGCIHDYRCSRL